jgi:hypothetical protein
LCAQKYFFQGLRFSSKPKVDISKTYLKERMITALKNQAAILWQRLLYCAVSNSCTDCMAFKPQLNWALYVPS